MESKWERMTLKEAGVSLIDCVHKTPPDSGEGYPYIAIPQMKEGRIDFRANPRLINESDFVEWTKKAYPKENDVVLSRRCNPGETAFVPRGVKFAVGQNLVLLRSRSEKVYPPFLRWLTKGSQWWREVNKYLNAGAVFDSLKCADVPKFEVLIPPWDEQKSITEILGNLDDKIELNRQMSRTLEAMAWAIFKAWFVDFEPVKAKAAGATSFRGMPQAVFDLLPDRFIDTELGPVPEGWAVKSLGDDLDVTMGQSPPSEYYNDHGEGLPFHQGARDYGFRFPTQRISCTLESRLADQDDVLISVRAPVGRINVADRRMVIGRGLAAAKHPEGHSSYALYLLKHLFSVEDAVGDGTIYKAITKKFLLGMPVVSPPSDIVAECEKLLKPLDSLVRSNEEASQTLAAIRDTLLPKLISGDLRVGKSDHPTAESACR